MVWIAYFVFRFHFRFRPHENSNIRSNYRGSTAEASAYCQIDSMQIHSVSGNERDGFPVYSTRTPNVQLGNDITKASRRRKTTVALLFIHWHSDDKLLSLVS